MNLLHSDISVEEKEYRYQQRFGEKAIREVENASEIGPVIRIVI